MFVFTVLLLSALSGAGSTAEDRWYQRIDPVTGEDLVCQRCAPGFRLSAHCTSSRQTQCVPCGAGLYTEFYNYIPNCLLCDRCSDNQRVVQPCNGSVNTVCECETGFFWDQHFCRRHTVCKPGHGVKTAGSPHRDTVCELCPDGQFADLTQAHAPCVKYSMCMTDTQLMLPGSKWHDNVCATCDHITSAGWVDLFRPVVSGLFVQHRIPPQRLQRFVSQRLSKQMERSHSRTEFQNTDSPVEQVQQWISQAPAEELLNLPEMLQKSRLDLLADKIRHKIRRFQLSVRQCVTSVMMS